jgi:hypothetical protein
VIVSSVGTSDNSPAFERRVSRDRVSSPEGTAEINPTTNVQSYFVGYLFGNDVFSFGKISMMVRPISLATFSTVPSRLVALRIKPGVETPGYFRKSLRDWEILFLVGCGIRDA